MVGIRLTVILALMGGIIALIADVLGKRIGKAHIRLFGLRPRQNARIMTVLSGMLISVLSITVVAMTSQSARIALFGMERLSKEIELLEKERDLASTALQQAKDRVQVANEQIETANRQIKAANENVASVKKEMTELQKTKNQLAGEITKLEKNQTILKDSITAMREGELFLRGGEVVYANVMRGNLSHEENVVQLDWLLRTANSTLLERLGIITREMEPEQVPQAIAFKQETLDRALAELDVAQSDKYYRIRTLTNVMVGEVSHCYIESFDNKLIYAHGALICREEYNLPKDVKNGEGVIMDFLRNVNRISVEHGVVPDPLTGNVGGIGAEGVLKVTNQLRKAGRHFVIEAKADGDIYTAGPVRLTFNVARIVDE